MKISASILRDLNACKSGYSSFVKVHGEAEINFYDCVASGSNSVGDYLWFIGKQNLSEQQLNDIKLFAVWCAEQCLPIFEKSVPKDDGPRKAIEAAKVFIENPTDENKRAADAARAAAYAAASAAYAARATTDAARATADAARAAARATAYAADAAYAAYAARATAYAADAAYAAAYAAASAAYAASATAYAADAAANAAARAATYAADAAANAAYAARATACTASYVADVQLAELARIVKSWGW